jgi:hypothetical protein
MILVSESGATSPHGQSTPTVTSGQRYSTTYLEQTGAQPLSVRAEEVITI